MDKIRIGILGLGHIGRVHITALQMLDDYQLVAVCDRLPDLEALAPPGVMYYTDFEQFLAEADCDTVVVATPNTTHYTFARAVVQSGRNLIVEKPAASSEAELNDLLRRADQIGVHVYFAFHAAKAPEVLALRRFLKDGVHRDYGPVTAFSSHFYDPNVVVGTPTRSAKSLEHCWYDSGINALTVLAELIDVNSFQIRRTSMARYDRREPEVLQAAVFFSFTVANHGHGGFGVIDTNWTRNLNWKETELLFAETGVSLRLSHSEQRIYLCQGEKESLLSDHADGRERLINHYLGVFGDYVHARRHNSYNRDLAMTCHSLLFSAMQRDREEYAQALTELRTTK